MNDMAPSINIKQEWIDSIHRLQDTICAAIEQADGRAHFKEDAWERPEGGGGRTRVIAHGDVFEKRWRKYFRSLWQGNRCHAQPAKDTW